MDKFRRIPLGKIDADEFYNRVAEMLNAHSDAIEHILEVLLKLERGHAMSLGGLCDMFAEGLREKEE